MVKYPLNIQNIITFSVFLSFFHPYTNNFESTIHINFDFSSEEVNEKESDDKKIQSLFLRRKGLLKSNLKKKIMSVKFLHKF